ncbi:hypothetical protein Tco_0772998 [Tanacetum coccineum]|uniref:Uncharacterized protein n=1 Tax=Tanacetum coccineum TaxID=301880 RepID=A0ABQ4ZKH3_9ASTR
MCLEEDMALELSEKAKAKAAKELAAYEAKRANMLEEYSYYITFRAAPLPITKIIYMIDNSCKQASMEITRNNQQYNLTVKRKRSSEILKEVFLKEDIMVDGMHRNLAPPPWIEGSRGLVVSEPKSGIFYNKNFDLCKTPASSEGLVEWKASMSNLGHIQVKDIVKEVEDYLKTYSSVGMDISWYVEGIRRWFKESQRWKYSIILLPFEEEQA